MIIVFSLYLWSIMIGRDEDLWLTLLCPSICRTQRHKCSMLPSKWCTLRFVFICIIYLSINKESGLLSPLLFNLFALQYCNSTSALDDRPWKDLNQKKIWKENVETQLPHKYKNRNSSSKKNRQKLKRNQYLKLTTIRL